MLLNSGLPRSLRVIAIGVVFAVSLPGAFAQSTTSLYGFYFADPRGTLYLAHVDSVTGSVTPIAPVGASGFLLGATAYDPVNKREFIGTDSNIMLVVDVGSGSVTTKHLTQPLSFYAVDTARGILYGVGHDLNFPELRSVNVSSGAVTSLCHVTTAANGWYDGSAVIDPLLNYFYYVDGAKLIQIDIAHCVSRAIAVSPTPGLLIIDRVTRQLFGFAFGSGPNGQIFRIDVITGATTPVALLPRNSVLDDARAFDPISRRFFVVQDTNLLAWANVDTGQVGSVTPTQALSILEADAGVTSLAVGTPALSSILLIVLTLALAGVGLLRWRSA